MSRSGILWHKANPDFSPATADIPVTGADQTLRDVASAATGSAFLFENVNGSEDLVFLNGAGAIQGSIIPIEVGIPVSNGVLAPIFNGSVAVAYQRQIGGNLEIHLQVAKPGSITSPALVSTAGVSGSLPDVAVTSGGTQDIDGDGSIVVVWQEAIGIKFRRFTDEGALPIDTTPRSLAGSEGGLQPKVAGLNDGGFMVAWAQAFGTESDGSSDFDLVVQRFDIQGNTVGDKVFIDNPGDQGVGMFNLSTLADGRVILAFDNETGNATNLTTLDYVILDPREQTIDGSSKSDTIVGRLDVSTISGLLGDDRLFGMSAGDTLIGGEGADRLDGGDGVDTASYAGSTASVTVNLATGTGTGGDAQSDTLVDVENLVGSAFADSLRGNDIVNLVDGGDGDDTLAGGLGNDTLTGGAGQDHFLFDTAVKKRLPSNIDTVIDFSVADDTIDLDNAVFAKLKKEGVLKGKFFHVGKNAGDDNDYVLYNKKTGTLSYDADGERQKIKPIEFADLDARLKLTHDDFLVI